jgi:peroxiredoxin
MKYIQILILAFLLIISCNKNNQNEFALDVKVNGEYSGYLYLNYGTKKDSCLIANGSAFFTGTVPHPIRAYYSTNYISASDKNFFIESEKIKSEITISKREIRNYNIDWITIDIISGTKTSIFRKDFEDYKLNYSLDKDWQKKLYDKLKKIIVQYPKHQFSGDLLHEIANDTVLSKEQIGELYHLLDLQFQNPDDMKYIEFIAFPEYLIKPGDSIFDFSLPNSVNSLVSTKDYRNQLLFIDFWASWCKPCREQFPELKNINYDFKDKGVTILGVSLDENKDEWLKTIEIENLEWNNVIDIEGFSGKVAKKYGILVIPYNVLVN